MFALLPFPFFLLLYTEVGFCDAMTTSHVDHGVYIWEETEVGSSSQTSCAFGPSNEQATRECESRSFWGEAQLLSCGTQVSHAFMEFNESAVREMTNLVFATLSELKVHSPSVRKNCCTRIV